MLGTKTIINKLAGGTNAARLRLRFGLGLVGLLCTPALLSAQTPDYFPLQTGNSWVYRTVEGSRTAVQSVEVGETAAYEGRTYHRLTFFGRTFWVRKADDGNMYSYDPSEKVEKPFIALAAAEGQTFDTTLDPCTKIGKIETRDGRHKGPLGEFEKTLKVSYQPSCADAGVTEQSFLPWIGLLQHVSTSIAGPQRYELIYSRTGFTQVTDGEVSFGVALDRISFPAGDTSEMLVRMTLRSTRPEPIVLTFPSAQTFDVAIRDDKNEVVYVWSRDKLFAQVVRTERFGPGEKNFAVLVPLAGLRPGKYVAEAWLTVAGPHKQYQGTVAFEIVGR